MPFTQIAPRQLSARSLANEQDGLPASLERRVQEIQNERRSDLISSPTSRSTKLVDHYIGNFMELSQGANLTPVQQYKELLIQLKDVKTQYEQLATICSSTIPTNEDPSGTTDLQ
jgi:hypothetical protein